MPAVSTVAPTGHDVLGLYDAMPETKEISFVESGSFSKTFSILSILCNTFPLFQQSTGPLRATKLRRRRALSGGLCLAGRSALHRRRLASCWKK